MLPGAPKPRDVRTPLREPAADERPPADAAQARAAAWGGLASRIAQRRGVRGTIMWGACRDVDEIRAIGYPVWSVAVCPRRSRNDFTFGWINAPITVSGVAIAPHDFIVADESGVIALPQARIDEVLALCDRIATQEAALEAQILNNALKSWDDV